jgi:septal ring factor EnvC (AmiA/AmiB activator)
MIDVYQQQIAQLEAASLAQKQFTQSLLNEINEIERKAFIADRNLCQFVDTLKDTTAAIAIQEELDRDRFNLFCLILVRF